MASEAILVWEIILAYEKPISLNVLQPLKWKHMTLLGQKFEGFALVQSSLLNIVEKHHQKFVALI